MQVSLDYRVKLCLKKKRMKRLKGRFGRGSVRHQFTVVCVETSLSLRHFFPALGLLFQVLRLDVYKRLSHLSILTILSWTSSVFLMFGFSGNEHQR